MGGTYWYYVSCYLTSPSQNIDLTFGLVLAGQ